MSPSLLDEARRAFPAWVSGPLPAGWKVLRCENGKLGGRKRHGPIWGMGLPSAHPEVCVAKSGICERQCYSKALEAHRASLRRSYRRTYVVSARDDFADIVCDQVRADGVRAVRWQVGGEMYSPGYARKVDEVWRRTRLRCRHVVYTRVWRLPEFKDVLGRLAARANGRLWLSCDKETGVPAREDWPARARIAYLQSGRDDTPAGDVDLVFRPRWLAKARAVRLAGATVCPRENGLAGAKEVTCSSCQVCYLRLPEDRLPGARHGRLSLDVVRA